jgi:hypothetical protein
MRNVLHAALVMLALSVASSAQVRKIELRVEGMT